MAKQTKAQTDVLALFAALGVTPEQVQEALAGTTQVQAKPQRKAIRVTVLEDEARQYGDVGISKAVNGGKYIQKLGVFAEDLDAFITDLQAARDALS